MPKLIQQQVQNFTINRCYVIDSEDGPYGYGAIHNEHTQQCTTLAIFPQNKLTQKLQDIIIVQNNLSKKDIRFFDNEQQYLEYLETHQQFIDFAIHVESNHNFTIYYNHSKIEPDMYKLYGNDDFGQKIQGQFSSMVLTIQFQVQNALNIINNIQQNLTIGQIPPGLNTMDVRIPSEFVSMLLIIFILIIQLVFVSYDLILDKQQRSLSLLRLLGMVDSIYLMTNFIWEIGIFIIEIILFVFTIFIHNNSSYFYYIDCVLLFTMLLITGIATTAFAFFVSSICSTIKAGIFISIGYSSLQICAFIIFIIMNSAHIFDSSFLSKWIAYFLLFLFPLLPIQVIFQQAFKIINPEIQLDEQLKIQIIIGNKLKMQSAFSEKLSYSCLVQTQNGCQFSQPTIVFTLSILIIQSFVFLFLAWSFYEYIEDNYSTMRTMKQIYQQKGQLSNATNSSMQRQRCNQQQYENIIDQNQQADENSKILIADSVLGRNNQHIVLQTHSLKKTFAQFQAVKSLSMIIQRGQLISLLGQNGSGKTTFINMIIGALRPDKSITELNQGYVNGFDIRSQIQQIRQQIGVCPQFSTLFDYLSPLQHLLLAQFLRNVSYTSAVKNAEEMLHAVQLFDRRHDSVDSLSGGMRRRVSIATAMVNDNSLIILDEPTGSLDPQCKRIIWDAIKYVKNGRKIYDGKSFIPGKIPGILLTSHDMTETEILADQIVVMEKGLVRAVGDPLQLKKNYNSGKYIVMSIKDKVSFMAVLKLLQKQITDSGIFLMEITAHIATIEITPQAELFMGQILSFLDDNVENSIILNYTVFDGSLEQVFLNLTRYNTVPQELESPFAHNIGKKQKFVPFFNKLFNSDRASLSALMGYIILPIILMIICLLVADVFIPWLISMVNLTLADVKRKVLPGCQLCKLIYSPDKCSGYDLSGNMRLCQLINKVNGVTITLPDKYLGGFQTHSIASSMYNASSTLFVTGTGSILFSNKTMEFDYPCIINGDVHPKCLPDVLAAYSAEQAVIPFSFVQKQIGTKYIIFPDLNIVYYRSSTYLDLIADVKNIQLSGGLKGNLTRQEMFNIIPIAIINLEDSVPTAIFSYFPFDYPRGGYKNLGIVVNNSTISLPPQPLESSLIGLFPDTIVVSPFSDLIARLGKYQVKVKALPFQYTVLIAQAEERAKVLISLFFLLLACSTVSPILAFNPILDREKGIIKLLNQLRVNPCCYWVATFIYQLLVSTLVHVAIYVFAAVFQLSVLRRVSFAIAVLLLATSVLCQVACAALLSVFRNASVGLLFGFVLVLVQALASLAFGHYENYRLRAWEFLTPQLALNSLFLLAGSSGKIGPVEVRLIVGCLVESACILVATVLMHLAGYLSYQSRAAQMYESGNCVRPVASQIPVLGLPGRVADALTQSAHDRAVRNDDMDCDVQLERERVAGGCPVQAITAVNVQKHYGPQIAVRDVTLSACNEIFGLLGSSGAGKSTLVEMMAGISRPSQGAVSVGLVPIAHAAQAMGLCLQDDVYLPSLTVLQHLEFFARIKGVDPHEASRIGECLGLGEKLSCRVGQLSGGMRRRMNLAIGMM
eukprot:EST48226.1 ABC transporter family protein [Spironucleus salmonicida]